MVRELGLQRSLQDCFGELFQQAVLADDVFRLLVIGQQLINEGLVDSHRFLILLFRWSFTQLLLQLPSVAASPRCACPRPAEAGWPMQYPHRDPSTTDPSYRSGLRRLRDYYALG